MNTDEPLRLPIEQDVISEPIALHLDRTKAMPQPAIEKFLTGMFATWLATNHGRTQPIKDEKALARMVARLATEKLFQPQGTLL